jgi:hypothetical protein
VSCLDDIPFPAYDSIDLDKYTAMNVLTSRGCPFRCSFCSVAPIWGFEPYLRSPANIIDEIRLLKNRLDKDLFLFQDEYLLASPERAKLFACIGGAEHLSRGGCLLRVGVSVRDDGPVLPVGVPHGFLPHDGVRVLPSLLCYLPQTRIYEEVDKGRLEFSNEMMPEYMLTGHETCQDSGIEIEPEYEHIYRFIQENKDIFPGFLHYDIEGNIRPKLRVLQELGFYKKPEGDESAESCGAHSAQILTRV